jgi:hypothetical protein
MREIIIMFVVILQISCITFSQNKFFSEIAVSVNTFSHRKLNSYYIDSFALPNKLIDNNVSSGFGIYFATKYKINFLDFGVFGNYLEGNTSGSPTIQTIDNTGNFIETVKGSSRLKTNAVSFG